ncbi:helix-turn-helix domain-containing protein [Anaerospora hongkongensis]|uniref:helix-turn-helix domain-containing protein n=1 Tax=Anaerospora hongkongensis TaxID=244830 RepID=UPI00289A5BA6|nr:helix-turn-helix transcriptional regulator [Anaerospora hongkongensis]
MPLLVFATRLKELRTKHGLKAEEFVNVGISRRMIFNYEAGESSPTLEKLEALANVFDVSLDYLCGRTNDPQQDRLKK